MPSVTVTGASTSLGRRVLARLDQRPPAQGNVMVHLAGDLRRGLSDAEVDGVDRVVLVSSAQVYGAWADNPVPLTEDAPLRPNPAAVNAVERAEAERVLAEWRERHPDAATVVLRPALVVGGDDAPTPLPGRDAGVPAQFLHEDDLADAVALAAVGDIDGVFNVAPDGWIAAETVTALVHPIGVPRWGRLSAFVDRVAHRAAPATAALSAYRNQPWVVANDRLRAAGWKPSHTNEEAWVTSQEPSVLTELSPSRRQMLALIGTGALGIGALAGVTALVLRRRRRRS
ncbi:MAG TPA: NAD-dependent epimerase/dehydratase family protein [Acidimicrobiales bacterium]|nr:NAD-dependent epimerase/dehydratase family protein [Acidimicrobiales bacterium]